VALSWLPGGNARGADAALRGYERYLETIRTVSFDFECRSYSRGGKIKDEQETLTRAIRGSVRRRADDFRLRSRTRSLLWRNGIFVPSDQEYEISLTRDRQLHLQTSYSGTFDSNQMLDFASRPGENPRVSARSTPDDTRLVQIDLAVLFAMYGELPYDRGESIAATVSVANPTVVGAEIEGHSVQEVSARTPRGVYTLWLDSSANYATRRILCVKTGDDLYGDTPLSKMHPIQYPEDDPRPRLPLKEFRFEVGLVELSSPDNGEHYIMSKFEVVEARLFEGGQSFVTRSEVSLSNVRFQCTDADLEPTLEIPDGTVAYLQDSPSIQAEWRDRQIVKIIDEDITARFEGLTRSTAVGGGRRWWLITGNVAVVALLLYIVIRRRWRPAS
jgi:hypothetical protein